ncbi:MAG: hypothetical protein ABL996_13415 [Micropepsaceae bacterium]
MNDWFKEAFRAPLDAWGLLLGLGSAFSVLALLHHEFAMEPLRVVIENWHYWSDEFWGALGSVFGLEVPRRLAICLSMMAFSIAVLIRGLVRSEGMSLRLRSLLAFAASRLVVFVTVGGLILILVMLGYAKLLDIAVRGVDPDEPLSLTAQIAIWTGLASMLLAMVFTPRSFFGVVIAAITLLLIDRIPAASITP